MTAPDALVERVRRRLALEGWSDIVLVEKGEPSLARITVAARLLGDLAKLHAA